MSEIPPPGYTTALAYPQPGDHVMVWRPATNAYQTGAWVSARIKDRRIRGLASRTALTVDGVGFPVRSRPIEHYATTL